jgi:hypothetical protein
MEDKKTIKIGFKKFWPEFEPHKFYFVKLLKQKYNVIICDEFLTNLGITPDYVFFSVYDNSGIYKINRFLKKILPRKLYVSIKKKYLDKRKSKMSEINDKTIKIYYSNEDSMIDMSKCDWAFSYHCEDKINNHRFMRLPSYARKEYNTPKGDITKELIKKEGVPPEKKTKFCNFLYSNEVEFRNNFFKKLNEYKRIDSPGRCMNNMKPLGGSFDKSRFARDWFLDKCNFLKDYKFTIAFENSSVEGYTTEKIIQPMLVGSIPIYWGNPRIGEDFNAKSFINLHDFHTIEEAIERIKEIDNDDKLYEQMLREPWLPNNKLTKWFDDKRIMNRLIEIIEQGEK